MPHYCGIPQSEEEEKSDKAEEQRLGKVRLGLRKGVKPSKWQPRGRLSTAW